MEVDKSLDSGESYFHRYAPNWNVQVLPASHCIYMSHLDDLTVTFRWIKPVRTNVTVFHLFFPFQVVVVSIPK